MRAIGKDIWREGWLLFGFLLIVVAGVLTVALPELSKEPDSELTGAARDASERGAAPTTTPAAPAK